MMSLLVFLIFLLSTVHSSQENTFHKTLKRMQLREKAEDRRKAGELKKYTEELSKRNKRHQDRIKKMMERNIDKVEVSFFWDIF